ncbi:MAG: ANTAR domain-containing protein [Pseudomonadota bacterium]
MEKKTKIAVVEADRDKALEIVDALTEEGWTDISVVSELSSLPSKIAELNPDVVLIDLENPNRDALEQASIASNAKARPVALFVDQSDDEMTQAAVKAGLSAYVVGGVVADRIRPILKTAIARFQETSQMRAELDAAKQALEDRKAVDRAKGLLMRAKSISEHEAYEILRKAAMDQNKKLVDVANSLIAAAEMLR